MLVDRPHRKSDKTSGAGDPTLLVLADDPRSDLCLQTGMYTNTADHCVQTAIGVLLTKLVMQ